jgi:hypothetical protein
LLDGKPLRDGEPTPPAGAAPAEAEPAGAEGAAEDPDGVVVEVSPVDQSDRVYRGGDE